MTTKLTLSIEEKVIKTAKTYAQKKGRSLSSLVENYLMTLSSNNNNDLTKLSPRVKRLRGSIKLPTDFDYKKSVAESINEKYAQ